MKPHEPIRHEILTDHLCREIDCLQDEIARITADRDYWREMYVGRLRSEEQHHKEMMVGVLDKLIEVPDEA